MALTHEAKAQIVKMRKSGRTLVDIGKSSGQSDYAVYQTLRQAGLVEEGSKGPKSQIKVQRNKVAIIEMREQGMTYKEIAIRLPSSDEISEAQIGNVCRGEGIDVSHMRPKNLTITFRRSDAIKLLEVSEKEKQEPEAMVIKMVNRRHEEFMRLTDTDESVAAG